MTRDFASFVFVDNSSAELVSGDCTEMLGLRFATTSFYNSVLRSFCPAIAGSNS